MRTLNFLYFQILSLSISSTLSKKILLSARSYIKSMSLTDILQFEKSRTTKKIILGSGSKSRFDILKGCGYDIEIMKPDIDEKALGNRDDGQYANELVTLIATAKADAILEKLASNVNNDRRILITADQVVLHNNIILEKPKDISQARNFMQSYKNSFCTTVGSIVLTDTISRKRVIGVSTASIYFGNISDEVIESMLAEGEVLYCAGGLMVEHPLIQPYVLKIEGSLNSLMGICTNLLDTLMTELNQN